MNMIIGIAELKRLLKKPKLNLYFKGTRIKLVPFKQTRRILLIILVFIII